MNRLAATILCVSTGAACTTPNRPADPEPIPAPSVAVAPERVAVARPHAPDPVPISTPTPPDTVTPRERATGRQPRTLADALYIVTDVAGRIVGVPDANGDGLSDFVVARGPKRGVVRGFDLLSSKDGSIVRRLYECAADDAPAAWDAGGDFDGDGVPDLVLGFPRCAGGAGGVLVVSGATAEIALDLRGSPPNERCGTSVMFLGDVDRDGHVDLAVSATQVDPGFAVLERSVRTYETVSGSVRSAWVQFKDGHEEDELAYFRRRLASHSTAPGFVSLRSGRDGTELWRAHGVVRGFAFGSSITKVGDLDGDRSVDIAVGCDPRSLSEITLLSGASGREVGRLDRSCGPVGDLGDVDGDGMPNLYVDTLDASRTEKWGSVRVMRGDRSGALFELRYPDDWSGYAITVGVGDLDGDGCADVAIGDANFNLLLDRGPGSDPDPADDVTRMTLVEAVRVESYPTNAWSWESGCAVVYSGRTREPIFGVWGAPGSRNGLGLEVAALPDVDGDGAPDLIVTDESSAYAFSGSGHAQVEAEPR